MTGQWKARQKQSSHGASWVDWSAVSRSVESGANYAPHWCIGSCCAQKSQQTPLWVKPQCPQPRILCCTLSDDSEFYEQLELDLPLRTLPPLPLMSVNDTLWGVEVLARGSVDSDQRRAPEGRGIV